MTDAEIHLMSDAPKVLVPEFVKAGADLIEIHYEAMSEEEVNYWLDYLKSNGVKTGLVLNPDTPVEVLKRFYSKLDQVLLMTVYPGFGGQKFLEGSDEKISRARELLDQLNPKIKIEVDGGINAETALITKNAGAEIFVAGSYIFGSGDIGAQVNKLSEIVK